MEDSGVYKERLFLKFIQSATKPQRKALLQTLSRSQTSALQEVVYNVLQGKFPIAEVLRKKLKRRTVKTSLRKFARKSTSNKESKAILIKLEDKIFAILSASSASLQQIWSTTVLKK